MHHFLAKEKQQTSWNNHMNKQPSIIKTFISKEAFSGVLLFVATILAVLTANSPLSQAYYDLWHLPLGLTLGNIKISMALTYWIDDGLMSLFFLMVGLEIKRELLIGELSSIKKASFPVVAAIGGMAVPALVFYCFKSRKPYRFWYTHVNRYCLCIRYFDAIGEQGQSCFKTVSGGTGCCR